MKKTVGKLKWKGSRGFFIFVLIVYVGVYALSPSGTVAALKNCGGILRQIAFPLCLVFVFMVLLNRFLNPEGVTKYIGKEAGFRGLFLASAAGILSVGPVYAWYPLLRNLREKGASNAALATFLGNRSVKPFLIPVMISYFGWSYVLILTVFTIVGAVAVGLGVEKLT